MTPTRIHSHSLVHPCSLAFTLARLAAVTVPLTGLAACQDAPVHDLGFRGSELVEEVAPPPRPELRSTFDGVWVGEAADPFAASQTYHFPSGSTQIVLELRASPEGYSSFITFGAGPGPAPATDPEVGYPRDPNFVLSSGSMDTSILPPTEGFRYSLSIGVVLRDLEVAAGGDRDAQLELGQAFFDEQLLLDGRADYDFYPNEVVDSWCALQTAESCPSNQQLGWDNGVDDCSVGLDFTPMDCQKASLCLRGACTCGTEGGCWANVERLAALTLGFEGEDLVGVFSGAVFVNERGFQQPLGLVHFQKQAASGQE